MSTPEAVDAAAAAATDAAADAAAAAAAAAPGPMQPGAIKSLLAGGVGGACLVFVGHPLDLIKVRLQAMPVPKAGEPPLYRGTVDCAMQTVRAEGAMALYKGMAAPIWGVTPMYALCFFGYGIGKKLFTTPESFTQLRLHEIAAAGATSALFTTPILAPGERAKCILQVQKDAKFKGPVDVWRHLYRSGGIASVNRGFCATLGRDSVASAFYFSSYELLKRKLTPAGADGPGVAGTLFAGGTAGILNWAAALPIDTLKSRLQVAPEGQYTHGIRSVFRHVVATEGYAALYRGWQAVMLRAFPANAACFAGYEATIKLLNKARCLDGY